MNLLPEQYAEKSRSRARSSRVAVAIIATLCTAAVFSTHSRFVFNAAVDNLISTQSRANSALELEVDATSLELEKVRLEKFLEQYQIEDTVFSMGDLIATISNMLPDAMTLEEFSLDVVQSVDGKGISGRLTGFAISDETIARFVSSLQRQSPFGGVSMDFSRSRTVRNVKAREFRISFMIDLSKSWKVSRDIVATGGYE